MKIQCEIKNDKFLYHYQISEYSKGEGEMSITAKNLTIFVTLLQELNRQFCEKTDKELQEISCFAYLEKHPELIEKYNKIRGEK